MEEKLTKHELRELRRKESKGERQEPQKQKRNGKAKYIAVVVLLVAIGVYMAFGNTGSGNSTTSPDQTQIPSNSIHWHPTLEIVINGVQETIPANIGLGAVHQPLHTHEADNVIHVENNNPTVENMKLGFFFRIWGKTFNSECIFEYCNDGEKKVKMFVNDVENFEFGDYIFNQKNYASTGSGEKIRIEYG